MKRHEFAAKRREELLLSDETLAPAVARGLRALQAGNANWQNVIVDAAAQIWLEHYQAEAPGAAYARPLARFRTQLAESLEKTSRPSASVGDVQTNRIVKWLSTYTINAATVQGTYSAGRRYKMWTTMEDEDVRDIHAPLAGKIVPIGSTFDVGGTKLAYPGEPRGPVGAWINCVVGSTLVEGAGQSVLSLTRRESSGPLVEIRTADGHHLTITPNHPVLTPGGYVPAEALSPGEKIMASRLAITPEVADAPPSVEEFYSAARLTGHSARMDGSAVNLHGDVAESEVEIVWPNRDLPLEVGRKFGEPDLVITDSGEFALVGQSLADATVPDFGGVTVGTGELTLRGVGIGREVAALLGSHPRHPKAVRLAGGANGQLEYFQIPGHDVAADAEVVRHLEHAISAGMSPTEIVSVEVNTVVGTHVYNLHTSANWYSANGIAVHNCRCVAMPASREGETMSANTFQMGPEDAVDDDNPDILVSNNLTAAADVQPGWASVMLIPAESDPIVAASSEPAHVTFVWFGDQGLEDFESVEQAVRLYAQDLDGPLVVPVAERGTLGDDNADVVFLELTDSLTAMRDGLLVNEPVKMAYDAAEQFPDWTPHVTLGYPETPALAEYDGTEVTFDRIGLWVGDEHFDYPMGGGAVTADAAIAEVSQVGTEDDMPIDEPEDDEELITEVPIHGVLAPEGILSGDGRGFREGAVTTRTLPVPYRYETVGSHGGNQTSEVVTVGRVDEVWTHTDGMVRFRGAIILTKPFAQDAIDAIIDGSGTGNSIDADAMEQDVSAYFDVDGNMIDQPAPTAETAGKVPETWYSSVRVAGLTQVPIPAFMETYTGLGHEFEEDMSDEQLAAAAAILEDCGCGELDDIAEITASATFAPGTKDGPVWVKNPVPTQRLRTYWLAGAGAAKIRWGTPGAFNRCRQQLAKYVEHPDWLAGTCANLYKEATGRWPGVQRGDKRRGLIAAGGIAAPPMSLVASGATIYPAAAFARPADQGRATPMVIDRETRTISGYAAQWGVCHIGIQGMCQEAPRSQSNYSYFRKGMVETDAGEQNVALLTYGIGHAGERGVSAAAATAHYDQTDAVRAYINIGEDQYGIWYSGVLAPWVTDRDIDAMLAIRKVSGDWRNWSGRRGDLEMVGLVVVNTEGFQLAASAALPGMEGGIQTAAIGIGVVPVDEPESVTASAGGDEDNEAFLARAALRVMEIVKQRERESALRARAYSLRQAHLRARANERG